MAENSGEILSVYLSDGSILNPWNGEPLLWCQNVHISLGGEGRPSLCLHQTTNQFFCSMFSLSCLVNKWSIGHSLAVSTKPPSTGLNVFGGDLLCGTTWLCCKHLLWIFLFIKYFECKYLHLKSAKEKVLAFLKANLQKCTSICIWLLVFSCQNNKKKLLDLWSQADELLVHVTESRNVMTTVKCLCTIFHPCWKKLKANI